MRLIDADDLIAKCGNLDNIATIKDFVDLMPAILVDWRWIPCEERQPDKNDWYLVTLDNGKRAFRWYLSQEHEWERIEDHDVTAWLPNPEPYKVFEQIVDLMEDAQWQRN